MNNGPPSIVQVYIPMDSPCLKEPPPDICAQSIGSEDMDDAENISDDVDISEDIDEDFDEDEADDDEADDGEDTEASVDDESEDIMLHNKCGNKHQPVHKIHRKFHRKHPIKNRNHKNHPFLDRCVAVGDFCGNQLFGCNFTATTHYRCTSVGSFPKVILTNAKVCGGTNEPPLEHHECTCPGSGDAPVCGYELPAVCNAENNVIYICRGGKGSKPEPLRTCNPGTICIKKSEPEGAQCGAGTCKCKGDGEVCSDSFPEHCNLEKNTIYRCTSSGTPKKVKGCGSDQTCVTLTDGAICTNSDCKCSIDGVTCGGIFPLSCKLNADTLYLCKKGEPPVIVKKCFPDRCPTSTNPELSRSCVDPCKCTGTGLVCGSTFPRHCKLDASTLYKCTGAGSTPTVSKVCKKGGCTVNNGRNKCNESKCTCPGSGFGPVCGHELPSECHADPNTIYICPGGSGTEPEPLSVCQPGTHCQKRPLPEGARCGANCECKGDNEVCSDSFPKYCKLKKNTIYRCTSSGKPEKVKSCKDSQSCVTVSDGAVCTNSDCKCPQNGVVCGEVFPLSCRLKTTALYTCTKGATPIFKSDCYPDRCSASKASITAAATIFRSGAAADTCTDACTCASEGIVCGSTFPERCNKDPMILYTCSGVGATPIAGDVCENGCTVTNGDDHCYNNKCTCPTPGTDPVCGSALPAECNADRTKIYRCPGGTGTRPKVVAICLPGTVCLEKESPIGAVCGSTSCDCNGNGEYCSDQFPDSCKLKENTIYKCKNGKLEKVHTCDTTKSCIKVDDGATCVSNDCKCPKDGVVCGKIFPLSCELKATALYTCEKGGTPVYKHDCTDGGLGCSTSISTAICAAATVFEANHAHDMCNTMGPCDCQGPSVACGSTYSKKCGLNDDTLYVCEDATGRPTPGDKCGSGQCIVILEHNECGVTCTCKDTDAVCGSAFDPSCNLDPDTLYTCTAAGATPSGGTDCTFGCQINVGDDTCKPDCTCPNDDDVCGSAFDPSCNLDPDTLYTCSAAGATPAPGTDCDFGCQINTGDDTCKPD
ncbi:hypothetical protein FBU30_000262, partial [Linnemannia zychae]